MRTKRCVRCAAEFPCGPAEEGGRCWCEALPPVVPMSDEGCLCPKCLRQEIDGRVGLCGTCRHAKQLETKSRAAVFLCGLSAQDPRFSKYPSLPMTRCAGYAESGSSRLPKK